MEDRLSMKGLLMKKMSMAVVATFILVGSVSASVTLEFVSTVGGTPASTYNGATNMHLAFGDMNLINTPGGLLDGVVVEMSDISVESKIQDYSSPFMSSALYDVEPIVALMGIEFYAVFVGDLTPTLIFSGDLAFDTMFTLGASATVNGSIDNIQLHNTQKWGPVVPQELVSLQTEGIADLVINLSASGYDITQYIDSLTPIPTMTVHGSIPVSDPVPEPSIVLLFSAGMLWLPFRKKNKAA